MRIARVRRLIFYAAIGFYGITWIDWPAGTDLFRGQTENRQGTFAVLAGILFLIASTEHALIGKIPMGSHVFFDDRRVRGDWFLRRKHPIMFWVSIAFEYLVGLVLLLLGGLALLP